MLKYMFSFKKTNETIYFNKVSDTNFYEFLSNKYRSTE